MPSTAIRRFDYDPDTATLDVTFVTDRRYRYFDVPPDVASAFERAESKGRFFNDVIRDRYAFHERRRSHD